MPRAPCSQSRQGPKGPEQFLRCIGHPPTFKHLSQRVSDFTVHVTQRGVLFDKIDSAGLPRGSQGLPGDAGAAGPQAACEEPGPMSQNVTATGWLRGAAAGAGFPDAISPRLSVPARGTGLPVTSCAQGQKKNLAMLLLFSEMWSHILFNPTYAKYYRFTM